MKRRGFENLAQRLAKRECLGAPPGAVAPHSRRLAENVVPDTPVTGLVPPPNTVLSCFSPCGRYLLAFQPVSSEVVAYSFKGLHITTSAAAAPAAAAAGAAAAAAPAAAPASATAGAQPPPLQPQQQFGEVFEERWRCCPCPGRQEQLCHDFCTVAHGRFLLVATTSPERQPPAGATGAAAFVPTVDSTTFHLLDLHSGLLLDSCSLRRDFVELARSQGAHLWGHLLLVLGLASQTLHVLQVLPSGRFLYLHAIGQHCRDDDALVIAQHDEAERRVRQHQHRQRQRQQQPAVSSATSAGSLSSLASLGAAAPAGAALAAAGAAGAGGAAPELGALATERPAAAAGVARQPAAAPAGLESDSEGEEGGGDAAAAADGGGPLLSGLKQCMLAFLFREAQRQSQEAAAAAAACEGACHVGCDDGGGGGGDGGGAGGGLGGAYGSTVSLLSAAAPPQHRLGPLAGAGGSTGSLSAAAGGGGACGGSHPHWRRPLDRFYFYFQAYCELVMWKAQVLDEQRLLIHWCPPEMMGGPAHHRGAAPLAAAGAGSYVMLYHIGRASVERLFVAHSSEFAAWYLTHPAAFCGSGCPCGCGSAWERCVPPPGGSCAARELLARDPGQAAKELRHRLADEIPVSSQTRQATPYLDPDLYCFDERSVGGTLRPHHPPHRPLKFMCRCQPERLRFRLDPELLAPSDRAGGRAAASARRRHVLYLFHPVQPFLVVACQDGDSGVAEQLTLFTRL